jgi:RNA polymerase sigma factor for flagellar operon FliA
MDLAEVWRMFKGSGERRWRNVLMENYFPIVKYNAERIGAKLPDEVDTDDLISAGVFGLIDALQAFDLTRGVKFETYCAPRIRGAILDELRSMDWVPRLVRSRAGKLERVARELESILGRVPTEDEIAKRLDLPRNELEKLMRDATAVMQISLSRKCNESDSNKDVCEIDVIEDKRGRNPIKEIQKRDVKALMMRGLTRAERLILVLYYYEEMTMREIGVTLDLSESRVSQMHSSILERLKTQLRTRRKELTR